MKFKVFILQLKFKNIALFCGFFFAFMQVNGQFFIPENSIVTLQTPLVSQEQLNIINNSIVGSSTLVFNAAFPQQLFAEQKISLPNINIHISNASDFTFNSSLEIEGNLSIATSTVYVLKPIELNGDLTVDASSSIVGFHLIIDTSQIHPKQTPLTNQQSSTELFVLSSVDEKSFRLDTLNDQKVVTKYKEQRILCNAYPIPTPPPEYRG